MGSSLSRQEELFLRRQWSSLLEAAIAADTEAMEADASSGATAGSSSTRSTRNAKAGFSLSFQEWQAFLAALERRGAATAATSAPSDVCATLTAAQLHVPAVALMVHLCVWWGGAIATDVLADRVDRLLQLVAGLTHGRESPPASAEEEPVSGGTPEGRRARLARFVKQRVAHLGKARGAGSSDTAAAAAFGEKDQQQHQQLMQLDVFADMTVLTQHLLQQEGLPAGDGCGVAGPIGTDAAALVELYDEKIGDPGALKQRPVLAVVMVTVLAVYACKARGQPQLAARSIAHLAALGEMMMSAAPPAVPSDSSAKMSSRAAAAAAATQPASPLAVMWPLMGELEVSLVHRQHEADARRSAGSDGDDLRATLRLMRENRAVLPRDERASVSRSPDARWADGASQYVGQRPIWAALRSHFLSASIFDADKSTVLIFFGPSGYGKSELARRVASVLHGVPMAELEGSGKLVYIHMPSFCTKDSIYSLVDPPAAHVGSGILLSALMKHPDAVVVLDEFEKGTAEAINNLWLSAFQKNGVLRSLKEASRSVSTVRATFILTCNIAADSITAREGLYLGATPADQEKIRGLFEKQCKDVCRDTMGEPFVNRVDAFFPFMPYTRVERRQFVCLLLERLLTSQAEKGRHLYATPGFVDAMVERLRTFHAATLEDAVRTQVLCMARAGWTTGVLTVERHVAGSGGGVPVLLPAHASELLSTTARAGGDDAESGRKSLLVEAWESLPGGSTSLALWAASSAAPDAAPPASTAATVLDAPHVTTPLLASAHVDVAATAAASSLAPLTAPHRSTPAPAELEKEHAYAVDTERVTELEKELAMTRELVRQRDLEIVTLKEKVLLLQKALALLLVSLLSCLCLMALVIGLKLTLIFALAVVGCLVLVLGVPLSVLLDAVRGLFYLLGPYKAGGLAVLLLAWLARASRSAVPSCP